RLAREHPHRGGLAGAVAADEADAVAGLHAQRGPGQQDPGPGTQFQVGGGDHERLQYERKRAAEAGAATRSGPCSRSTQDRPLRATSGSSAAGMPDVTAAAPQDLPRRAALVTGASRAIGCAIARELLGRGASVTITARNPDALTAAAEELAKGADPDRVLAVPGNAGSAEARAEAVDRTVERFGNLAILVNNTGINPTYGPLVD